MRVLIVDDDALIRDGLKVLLELEEDFTVVGAAADGQEALSFCEKDQPDLVLMDIRMPVLDGVLGTREIKGRFPGVKVVILTTFKDDEYLKEAIKAGAAGYILKSQPAESIIESLRAVGKGNAVFGTEVAGALTSMLREEPARTAVSGIDLTPREMDILRLLGDGLSNKEIAEKLFLGEGTVRNYITALLAKLGLRDRTQLAIHYLRHLGGK